MTSDQVLAELKAFGTDQTRRTFLRHGVAEPVLGVKYGDLDKVRRRIRTDHELARELWASGIHEARVLATMIADVRAASDDIDRWAEDAPDYVIADAVAALAAKASGSFDRAADWLEHNRENVRRAGWTLIARIASSIEEDLALELLRRIEADIHASPNRLKQAMNTALIAIGATGGVLTDAALGTAGRIGRVEVDHGDTACKTPDAATYIRKTLAHRTKKGAT